MTGWWALGFLVLIAGLVFMLWPFSRKRGAWVGGAPRALDAGALELLRREKVKLQRLIKDLETERETGAITDEEYEPLRRRYLREVVLLQRRLDHLEHGPEPVDPGARETVAARTGDTETGADAIERPSASREEAKG